MRNVYVVKCPDYEQVGEKMKELLGMMDGIGRFVKSGEKIILKPNLLTAVAPEKAATTHPAVVAAVARAVKDEGAVPVILDSPGSGYAYNQKTMERVYQATGMYDAAEETGIETCMDTSHQIVSFPKGEFIKRFEVITPVLEAAGLINLCKLKTHGFLSMTGAVKNSFGVVPGLTKPGYHAKLQDAALFASMCLDLSQFVSPRLSIMDAVIGMEGNGPHGGTPRHVGVLLASEDPLSLDIVAGEIMGLEWEHNPILVEAEKRGIIPNRLEEVTVIGFDKHKLRIPDFKLPPTVMAGAGALLLNIFGPLLKHGLTVRPYISKDKCVACGACRDACPVHVISIEDKHANIDYKHCIRCYCCHEMCQYDAIDLQSGLLYRLLNRGA